MKKDDMKSIMLLVQTVMATSVFSLGIGYMFENSYLELLEIILALLVFIVAFNNHRFFKIKMVTPACIIFGVILIVGVII